VTDLSALYALRLRTPRLVLRLGNREELEALGRVAAAGIHPPDEMPFAIAWTDASSEPGFVDGFAAFHEEALATWTPERWMLNLIAFADGEPVGTQGIGAMGFATERTVETGSWLGAASPGHGLGTEMRVAVLELAFGVLGAVAARSGWSEGGAGQSARVSARLGYRETGTHILRPRDEPVVQHDLLLERDEWRCPIDVELEAVGPCLPLFGAPPDPRLATDQIARLAGS
jgi:RimJ/RimL family protein N-acetyltransferase